jgi:hypothetical protein
MSKTLLIPVRTDRLNTPQDIQYAIVNREEQLQGRKYEVPEIVSPYCKVKIKESVGLWNFITGCLP